MYVKALSLQQFSYFRSTKGTHLGSAASSCDPPFNAVTCVFNAERSSEESKALVTAGSKHPCLHSAATTGFTLGEISSRSFLVMEFVWVFTMSRSDLLTMSMQCGTVGRQH